MIAAIVLEKDRITRSSQIIERDMNNANPYRSSIFYVIANV